MKKLYLFAVTLLLSFTIVMAQEKQEKIGDTPQLKKVSKQAVGDQTSGAIKVNSTTAVVTYDFTTGPDKYYNGAAGAKDLGGGVWGMIAGETNSSGVVTNADKDLIDANINATGYLIGDTNLSGVITNADKDDIDANINRASQVPN